MTKPTVDLDLSADDIGVGLTLKTKDGKTITLNAFSVKDNEEGRVRLDDLKIGDKLRLRSGRVLKVITLYYSDYNEYACYAIDDSLRLHYLRDGRSNLHSKEDEVIEIIRVAPAPISLKDLKIGQKVRLRRGDVVTCVARPTERPDQGGFQYIFVKDTGCALSFTVDGLFFGANFTDEKDIAEILPYEAPRVSIKDAKEGDTFVLRNGKEYIFTGETGGEYGNLRTIVKDGRRHLYFRPNGTCPNRPDDYEVVTIIPAPKPTLSDRISAQLNKIDAKVERIVVSRDDWKALRERRKPGHGSFTYLHGVRLKHSDFLDKGQFTIVFAAD